MVVVSVKNEKTLKKGHLVCSLLRHTLIHVRWEIEVNTYILQYYWGTSYQVTKGTRLSCRDLAGGRQLSSLHHSPGSSWRHCCTYGSIAMDINKTGYPCYKSKALWSYISCKRADHPNIRSACCKKDRQKTMQTTAQQGMYKCSSSYQCACTMSAHLQIFSRCSSGHTSKLSTRKLHRCYLQFIFIFELQLLQKGHLKPSCGRSLSKCLSVSTWTFSLTSVNYIQWRKHVSLPFHSKVIKIDSLLFVCSSDCCHKEQHQKIIKCIFIAEFTQALTLSHHCRKKYWGAVLHFRMVNAVCWSQCYLEKTSIFLYHWSPY